MSALLKKEIRLLLPSWPIALVLALSAWLIADEMQPASRFRIYFLVVIPFFLCPAMVLMMALGSFGRELSTGTFSNLLVQPIPRARIWWTKTLLLAAALVSVWAVWWLSLISNKSFTMNPKELHEAFVAAAIFAPVAYSGGLWTVLLLRQVAAAFWFTLLIPAALAMVTVYFTEKFGSGDSTERNLVVVLATYSIAGFWGARRMFLRAQDVQWTGGTIAWPGWLKLPRWFDSTRRIQGRRPRLALVAKEVQLHQSQLVIAGALALLHLGVIATRKFGGDLKSSPVLEFLLGQFWVVWFAMPLLVGCAAVAEERKLGTLEVQLCLPVRRRTQFVIKFTVAFLLAVVLGAVMPALLEGGRILPEVKLDFGHNSHGFYEMMSGGVLVQTVLIMVEAIKPLFPFLALAGIAAFVGMISFYASTLARNTLQALAPAVLGILVAAGLLEGALGIEYAFHHPFWRGWLVYLLGVPAMTLALAGLTYWNYQRALVGWGVWRRNALVFFASLALVIVATTAIYHRAWERLTPLEPPHGAPRLTSSQPVTMRADWLNLTAQLPDGRYWSCRFALSTPNLASMLSGDWKMEEMFGRNGFLDGTNWASGAFCYRDFVGIQKDGSLWVSEQPEKQFFSFPTKTQLLKANHSKLVRLGNDNNWKSLAGKFSQAFLLKTDGTLWRLGTNRFNWKVPWPGLRAFDPQRLGTDSDWEEIFPTEDSICFRKTDGRAWVNQSSSPSRTESLRLDEQLSLERVPHLEQCKWRSRAWSSSPRTGSFRVGVCEDGTFRMTRAREWQASRQSKIVKQDFQLGQETNWLAVAGDRGVAVTLKADGSLWKWDFPEDPLTKPGTASAAVLSTYSDWVAITGALGGVVSLAADGSLWFWQFEPRHEYPWGQTLPPLLAASRRPQLIGNIFKSSAP